MFDEMERMMESMRRSMYDGVDDVRSMAGMGSAHMSLEQTDDGYLVMADIPGFEKEEIDLRFDDGKLVVDARHEVTDESPVGSISRSRHIHEALHVPGEIIEDEIEATYRNGVLEVSLPTMEAPDEDDDAHRIDID
ncbi:Hsp20/alpha crystallin family protein [Halorarius litoreus]|uniref:Hsp20/alpha crystallin family protein n=1 Tax=Halorarius litoreus TaxID=2962676 RepID=UPI0020CDC46F|nr:Hsp20/alpha crystallin family protein [Halorarius litoreus]